MYFHYLDKENIILSILSPLHLLLFFPVGNVKRQFKMESLCEQANKQKTYELEINARKFGIKLADQGQISTVKRLRDWLFERKPFGRATMG